MSATTYLVDLLQSVPPPIATAIIAMLPVAELRGAIPVAISVYHMSIVSTLFWSILGNMIPVYFLLVFFERVSNWLRKKSPAMDRWFNKLIDRTRQKLAADVEKYGWWALAIFVAIPLPATGAWTGTLAAFIFGMPKKKAFFSILVGVIIAAIVVTGLTLGVSTTLKAIF